MKPAVYFRLRQKIESQRESDLASLDRVWYMENGTTPPKMEQDAPKKGNVSKAVKAVVAGLHGTFTISEVIAATIKTDSTLANKVPAIRTAFKRLDVEMASPKAGAKQALYRIKKATPNSTDPLEVPF